MNAHRLVTSSAEGRRAGPGLIKASNSSLLRAAAVAIQTRPKASAKTQASGEPLSGTLSAKTTRRLARKRSLLPTTTAATPTTRSRRLHCGQSPRAASTVRMRRRASYEATSLTPDALALAGPACLPPPRSGDCAATLPAARWSASPYLLAASRASRESRSRSSSRLLLSVMLPFPFLST